MSIAFLEPYSDLAHSSYPSPCGTCAALEGKSKKPMESRNRSFECDSFGVAQVRLGVANGKD